MTKSFFACALALTVAAAAPAVVLTQAQKATDSDAVAAVTKLENDAIKAALANDSSFYEKTLASDYTGGTSFGTWDTKASMLADMKDAKNNKTSHSESQGLESAGPRRPRGRDLQHHLRRNDPWTAPGQNNPLHGRAPAAERRLEADGDPLLSSGQVARQSRHTAQSRLAA